MDLETVRQNTTATILRFSVPAIVAMLLTSLITVADGFFVGNYVGAEGIAVLVQIELNGVCRRRCACANSIRGGGSVGVLSGVSADCCDDGGLCRSDGCGSGVIF